MLESSIQGIYSSAQIHEIGMLEYKMLIGSVKSSQFVGSYDSSLALASGFSHEVETSQACKGDADCSVIPRHVKSQPIYDTPNSIGLEVLALGQGGIDKQTSQVDKDLHSRSLLVGKKVPEYFPLKI